VERRGPYWAPIGGPDCAPFDIYVEVQGHTDATGPKDHNYRLGEARAETVRRYLNQHGVAQRSPRSGRSG